MYPPGINTFIYDLQHKKQTCFQDSTTSIMHANLGIKPDSVTSKQDVCFFISMAKLIRYTLLFTLRCTHTSIIFSILIIS